MAVNKLYDQEFVDTLPPLKPWNTPAVVYVAREATPGHSNMKQFLETAFARVPDRKKAEVYARLRSLDDKTFIAQVFELYVADFCGRYGEVDFDPVLADDKTPDVLWSINGHNLILDVATVFDEEAAAEEIQAVNQLLGYLHQVEHYFHVLLDYDHIDLHNLRPSAIRDRLIQFLDSQDPNKPDELELYYDGDGLTGRFSIVPRRDPTTRKPIAFAVMEPGRDIIPVPAIAKRIKSKVKKYKGHGPVVVALCKGGKHGLDWDDIATTLYGQTNISYDLRTKEPRIYIGPGGLVMPRGNLPPNNRSLVGVLYCNLMWDTDEPNLQVYFLVNPFSETQISLPIPTYPVVEEGQIKFRWSDDHHQETLGVH